MAPPVASHDDVVDLLNDDGLGSFRPGGDEMQDELHALVWYLALAPIQTLLQLPAMSP